MDKYIDVCFERVEKALATLIDSVSKYNPSSATATELVEADTELSKGIELVQTHQNNHLEIQSLRATITALDNQTKGILTQLASVRRELTTTGTGINTDPSNEIRYDELLSYARRISKTTLPPPGITNGLDAGGEGSGTPPSALDTGAAPTPAGAGTPLPQANGIQTPQTASTPAAAQNLAPATPAGQQQQQQQSRQLTPAGAVLPPSIAQFMNPLTGQVFLPWPEAGRFRLGALAANQRLLEEEGLADIRGYDPIAAAEAAARAAEEERARAEALEAEEAARMRAREAAAREERARIMQERGAAAAASGGPAEPVRHQFQFLGDDDDEDDD